MKNKKKSVKKGIDTPGIVKQIVGQISALNPVEQNDVLQNVLIQMGERKFGAMHKAKENFKHLQEQYERFGKITQY